MHKTIENKKFADVCSELGIDVNNNTKTSLHWMNGPCNWHVNHGNEVFAVLNGVVNMHFKKNNQSQIKELKAGDVFYGNTEVEYVARPFGDARVLVIEKEKQSLEEISILDFKTAVNE